MTFEWDDSKNSVNVSKHGFDFTDAHEVFEGPVLARLDSRKDYGENRWQGVGLLRGRLVVIVYTERDHDRIRIISLRKANRHERDAFQEAIQD